MGMDRMDGMVMDDCGADADGELIVWRAPKKKRRLLDGGGMILTIYHVERSIRSDNGLALPGAFHVMGYT
jgi:hypothetical protein